MKKLYFLIAFLTICSTAIAQTIDASYYLPKNHSYNKEIPKPESILGFTVGEWHVSHDKLSEYMRALAKASDRISIENRGSTYEGRPLFLLTITSPKNHQNLEFIKEQHTLLSEPESKNLNINDMPAVVYQGFSIHGNEASGANAGLMVAYHLAASLDPTVEELLNDVVILFDPSFNPDGLQRFSQWVNTHKSNTLNPDPNDREFNESWPRGRTNHYWFDMNRDWLPVQLPESKARIKSFSEWLPNILTDHHEMGTNATFFFQPGIQSRVNPLTPQMNQILTKEIGEFHAEALNEIGSLYYTEESFDDFYYGKGSTYPDVNGSIGILFEQASSRGHIQESDHGLLTFPFTIRNQFKTALSTLKAAKNMRVKLLNYQRKFYADALKESNQSKYKSIVFGNEKDPATSYRLAEILKRHKIKIHKLKKDTQIEGEKYAENASYVVPLNQKKNKLIHAMFDTQTKFQDSLFYDISAWTFPLAFNLNYSFEKSETLAGEEIKELSHGEPADIKKSSYAYLLESNGYYTPKFIYKLLDAGVRIKVGLKPFSIDGNFYDYGSIMIPVAIQDINSGELYNLINDYSSGLMLDIKSVETGLTEGIDLGSNNFKSLQKPKVALLVGDGVRSYDAGEIWHLMDIQYQIPVTKIDVRQLNRIDLSRYTHFIIPSYTGSLLNANKNKIESWIKTGGTLVAYRDAIKWTNKVELTSVKLKSFKQEAEEINFDQRSNFRGAQNIGGAIFNTNIDRSHPINFGIEQNNLPLFRNSRIFIDADKQSYNNPLIYSQNPLLSGYISKEQLNLLKGSVPFKFIRKGRGNIILLTDNTNFRAFWYGTNKLFANTLFYSNFMK
ncbi:M14 family metallopeptidase [Flavobacteriaceae bacterium]|nr:M14 family metallopeptidase [Flavobacteriaceae bacterium]MDC0960123.1 M14 family metallopeptidase [Flavobacteriaceae bacterium]